MEPETLIEETTRAHVQFVPFWHAGTSVKGEFHCAECSYGIVVMHELPTCPMCGGTAWEQASWSPFRRSRGAA